MPRWKNVDWPLEDSIADRLSQYTAQMAVLMDIRDELRTLNRTFDCPRFLNIPHTLIRIAQNTAKKRKR